VYFFNVNENVGQGTIYYWSGQCECVLLFNDDRHGQSVVYSLLVIVFYCLCHYYSLLLLWRLLLLLFNYLFHLTVNSQDICHLQYTDPS